MDQSIEQRLKTLENRISAAETHNAILGKQLVEVKETNANLIIEINILKEGGNL